MLGYDPSNALVSRQVSNGSYSFHGGAASLAYTPNGLDQYPTISPGGTSTYTAGNTTFDASSGGTFGYDLENRLTTASAPTAVTLAYDAAGRLQTKTAGGVATSFLYAGAMLVGEYASAGTILSRYIPGPAPDETALMYSGAGTTTPQWLHADAQGSTIACEYVDRISIVPDRQPPAASRQPRSVRGGGAPCRRDFGRAICRIRGRGIRS